MESIAGIPYLEARFDENGVLRAPVDLPAGLTDVVLISHGWNNNEEDARQLYRALFKNFAAVTSPPLPNRRIAIVGVLWPSKAFDELVTESASGAAGGAAGLAGPGDQRAQQLLVEKIERMQLFFTEPTQRRKLDEAKALLPDLEHKGSAREKFVELIRSLLDRSAADREDASETFFKADGKELMQTLKIAADDEDEDVLKGGGAALPLGKSPAATAGGAAGLSDLFSGFKAAAMNVLNFATYFAMKQRAGTVGRNGVAKLIDQLAPQVLRLHLIGHSFGGRVVTMAASHSSTDRIKSMTLLQAAFSHNGFSKTMQGAFRRVVDQQRIRGPLLVTHTKNDKAVGAAYPLASRISGDRTAAFGDENDVFGGIGRNGAQKMDPGETIGLKLLAVGGTYPFQSGKIFNLQADAFIQGHSDVTGREVAYAIRCAVA